MYTKSAIHGNSEAQHIIGIMYRDGCGVKQDYNEAMDWFGKAVDDDEHPPSLYAICLMYSNGLGVEINNDFALRFFIKSTTRGNSDAQVAMGQSYQDGLDDYKNAMHWFQKAVDNDENANDQLNIVFMYHKGIGVEKNDNMALQWYRKSATKEFLVPDITSLHFITTGVLLSRIIKKL